MKKLLALLSAAALVFSLCACTINTKTANQNAASDAETAQTQKTEKQERKKTKEQKKEKDVIIDNDCAAKIVNCELSKDADGNDAVTLTMEFQNNRAQPLTFNNIFYEQVFQNGVEQFTDNFYVGDDVDVESYYKEIKDGAKITVIQQHPIANTTDPVEVTITAFESGEKISKTFNLK